MMEMLSVLIEVVITQGCVCVFTFMHLVKVKHKMGSNLKIS